MPLLEAVKDELHARRDAQFIENPQQVIPNDLLASGGASARMVALVCYAATALLGLIGFVGVRAKPAYFFILASGGVGALLVTAIRMGALRLDKERCNKGEKRWRNRANNVAG